MKVLMTGGTGKVGAAATQRLVDQGWDVRVIGRREGIDIPDAEYVQCDATDFDAVRQAMRGRQAVVHLAAVASPMGMGGQDVFRINTTSTYNVFEAAAAEGIRRVVQASSINAFGCFWSIADRALDYLPIDEAHPTYTTDPYSFSKNAVEAIGEYYWRREGISSVALRLPAVYPAQRQYSDKYRDHMARCRELLDEFAAQPAAQRRRRLAEMRRLAAEYRAGRRMEFPACKNRPKDDGLGADPLARMYVFDRFDFWAYVDDRDSAQSIEKGLTADYEGAHALFINDDHNRLDYDAETLAELFYPEVSRRSRPMPGSAALVSIDRARELIGFEVEYSIAAPPA